MNFSKLSSISWFAASAMVGIALIFAACFASSLEVTSSAVVLVLLAVALGFNAVGSSGRPWRVTDWLILVAGCYGAWKMATGSVVDLGRRDAILLGCGVISYFWFVFFSTRRAREIWVNLLFVLALASVGVATYQAYIDPSFTPFFAFRGETRYPSGFYAHYNHFANFLLPPLFLAIGRLFSKRSGWKLWLSMGLVIGACLFGLVLSRSRGAFCGLGFGLLAVFVLNLLRMRKVGSKQFGPILIAVILLLPVFAWGWFKAASQVLAERKDEGTGMLLTADGGRLKYYEFAVAQISDFPWTGAGSRSYSYKVFDYWDPKELWTHSFDLEFVHNEFLQAATDYGLIGLVAVAGILIVVGCRSVVVLGVEGRKEERVDDGVLIGALGALVAVLTQAQFSFVFHMAPDVVVLGALLGLLVSEPFPFDQTKVTSVEGLGLRLRQTGMLVVATSCLVLGWRDLLAWSKVGRPGGGRDTRDPYVRLQLFKDALQIRPDYEWEEAAAMAEFKVGSLEAEGQETRALNEIQHYQRCISRHPYHYSGRLNLAIRLDQAGKLMEAEPQYEELIPRMDTREKFYGCRFYYGNHCYLKAYKIWRVQKKPAIALAWALEARRQIQLSMTHRQIQPGSLEMESVDKLNQFISWLEGAKIIPSEGVVSKLGADSKVFPN